MGMRSRFALSLALFCIAAPILAQGEPGRFAVSQVTFRPPVLLAYVDVLNQDGQPPARLVPADLSARIAQRHLGVQSVTPFSRSGEGVAYLFLVDVSKSISRPQFDQMRNEITDWINRLTPNDRMAIFTFGEQDRQLIDFTADKGSLVAALQRVMPTDKFTRLYLALRNAIDVRQRTDAGLPSRRVIVVVSDGKDEGSGLTADDVGHMFQQSPVPIYAIGFSTLPAAEKSLYLDALNRVAALSGGLYLEGSSLPEAYEAMREAIRRVFLVRLECRGCQISSQSQPLELTYTSGATSRADRLEVSVSAPAETAQEPLWKQILEHISWKLAASVAIGLGVVITVPVVIVVKGKKPEATPVTPLTTPPQPVAVVPPAVVPATGRQVELTVLSGNQRGHTNKVTLASKVVVGRDSKCDVAYPHDAEMSARHFELIDAGDHVEVQDLGSSNGTLLNGARLVSQQRIEDGDWVRAGRTEVRITFGA